VIKIELTVVYAERLRLPALAIGMLGSSSDADDVLQERKRAL